MRRFRAGASAAAARPGLQFVSTVPRLRAQSARPAAGVPCNNRPGPTSSPLAYNSACGRLAIRFNARQKRAEKRANTGVMTNKSPKMTCYDARIWERGLGAALCAAWSADEYAWITAAWHAASPRESETDLSATTAWLSPLSGSGHQRVTATRLTDSASHRVTTESGRSRRPACQRPASGRDDKDVGTSASRDNRTSLRLQAERKRPTRPYSGQPRQARWDAHSLAKLGSPLPSEHNRNTSIKTTLTAVSLQDMLAYKQTHSRPTVTGPSRIGAARPEVERWRAPGIQRTSGSPASTCPNERE